MRTPPWSGYMYPFFVSRGNDISPNEILHPAVQWRAFESGKDLELYGSEDEKGTLLVDQLDLEHPLAMPILYHAVPDRLWELQPIKPDCMDAPRVQKSSFEAYSTISPRYMTAM